MGLLDFFKKQDDNSKQTQLSDQSRSTAADPQQIPTDKQAEDLAKLTAFENKINSLAKDESQQGNSEETEDNGAQSLKIQNPFRGI